MKTLLDDVRTFMVACDQPVLTTPACPTEDRAALRSRLIREEANETLTAIFNEDLEEIADGLADLIYVAVGTALEYGIPLDRVWAEVQRSNMAKVDPATGKVAKREDGKVLKPEGWTPPDIAAALRQDEFPEHPMAPSERLALMKSLNAED